MGDGNKVDDCK